MWHFCQMTSFVLSLNLTVFKPKCNWIQQKFFDRQIFATRFMCGSGHFDSSSNDEFSVECLFWFFKWTWKSDLKVIKMTKNDLFRVNAPLWYFECAPNCKTWPQLKKMTIFDIQHQFRHSTPCPNDMNQTFVSLVKKM